MVLYHTTIYSVCMIPSIMWHSLPYFMACFASLSFLCLPSFPQLPHSFPQHGYRCPRMPSSLPRCPTASLDALPCLPVASCGFLGCLPTAQLGMAQLATARHSTAQLGRLPQLPHDAQPQPFHALPVLWDIPISALIYQWGKWGFPISNLILDKWGFPMVEWGIPKGEGTSPI